MKKRFMASLFGKSILALFLVAVLLLSTTVPRPVFAGNDAGFNFSASERFTGPGPTGGRHIYPTQANAYVFTGPFFVSPVSWTATVVNLANTAALGTYAGPIVVQGMSTNNTVCVAFQSSAVSNTSQVLGVPVAVSVTVNSPTDLYSTNAFMALELTPTVATIGNSFFFYVGYQPQ